jgi:DNA repair protein RadA/Sms
MDGARPLLLETQALVSTAVYGTPQRTTNGFDSRRLNMLLAVLEKRCGFQLGVKDVFVNIAGGMRVDDPALDLSVISAILSSAENYPILTSVAFAGEIGLSGEVRAVSRVEQRLDEVSKLGFKHVMISKFNKLISKRKDQLEIVQVATVEDVFEWLFKRNI